MGRPRQPDLRERDDRQGAAPAATPDRCRQALPDDRQNTATLTAAPREPTAAVPCRLERPYRARALRTVWPTTVTTPDTARSASSR
jgi:hypothetical protein